jgi:hypothetical protein
MYRTRPITPVALTTPITARIEGSLQPLQLNLEGETLTAPAGRRQCVLKTSGTHQLTLTFTRLGGGTSKQAVRVRVLSPQETQKLSGAMVWALPEKAIYLLPGAEAKWSETPEAKREQIRLERPTFAPLKPQHEGEDEWWRLRAWNELVSLLRSEWLPSIEMLNVFENAARPSLDRVAYVAYMRGNYRVIFISEIGKQAWIYIEQPSSTTPSLPQPQEILAADLFPTTAQSTPQAKITSFPETSFASRTFRRYHALTAEGPSEPVHIRLIHVVQPSQLNLKLPGY